MGDADNMSFWDHLDILRGVLLRCVVVIVVMAVVAFCFKDQLFAVVLAPCRDDFPSYRLLGLPPFGLHLINTGLTEQLMMHIKVAVYAGLFASSPYWLYELFGFVSPALYQQERRLALRVVGSGYLMFVIGTLLCFFLIFPLTLRFLGTYQVSESVDNMLTLSSYVDTMITLMLCIGIVFQLPVICWLLGRMGIINRRMMSCYRRHAIVVILIVAAVITPTTDVFTLLIVSLPVWLLYELSILIVRK